MKKQVSVTTAVIIIVIVVLIAVLVGWSFLGKRKTAAGEAESPDSEPMMLDPGHGKTLDTAPRPVEGPPPGGGG